MKRKEKFGSMRARRNIVVSVPMGQIVDFFRRWKSKDFIRLPDFKEIPENAKLIGTYHDFRRNALMLMFSHPSFPLVAPGQEAPERDLEIELVKIKPLK